MRNRKLLSVLAVLGFVVMIVVNALANIIPINGVGTGQISDKYVNLFAPAGYVFSIWLVIYILLGMYSFYQYGLFRRRSDMSDRVIFRVNQYFIVSSLLNTAWIFAWHYEKIGLSLLLMLGIFYVLLQARITITHRSTLNHDEKISVKLPFSVYFGWICVATIANVTTFLVSINWNRFGLREDIWTMIILGIGATIGLITTLKWKDLAYGAVFVWAYTGILVKHLSLSGFNGAYSGVMITTSLGIFCFAMVLILISFQLRKENKKRKEQMYLGTYAPKAYEREDSFEEL
jgi:hypothetical protein